MSVWQNNYLISIIIKKKEYQIIIKEFTSTNRRNNIFKDSIIIVLKLPIKETSFSIIEYKNEINSHVIKSLILVEGTNDYKEIINYLWPILGKESKNHYANYYPF